jgi:ribonuclease-3
VNLSSLYTFRDSKWLDLALTHKSFANERRASENKAAFEAKAVDVGGAKPLRDSRATQAFEPKAERAVEKTEALAPAVKLDSAKSDAPKPEAQAPLEDNERLEFLGDAVLSAVLSARLMREFPNEMEGSLSKRRASLVNEERLAQIATRLGLHESLKLGKGEIKTGGAAKPRILACGLEALIGAMFFDSNYVEVERVVNELFNDEIRGIRESTLDFERDYKTRLQEWSHEQRGQTPNYILLEEFGPAHSRGFRVSVSLGDREFARGEGKSKKAAEQEAARAALKSVADEGSNERQ